MTFNLRIKLFFGFGAVLLTTSALGMLSWASFNKFSSDFRDLYQNNVKAATYLSNAQNALWELRFGLAQFLVLSPEARKAIPEAQGKWYQMIDENMKAYEATSHTPEEAALLKDWNEFYPQYVQARPYWFQLVTDGKDAEAAEWRAKKTNFFGPKSVKTLSQLIGLQQAEGTKKQASVSEMLAGAHRWLLALCIFAMAFGVGIWLLISHNISQGLESAIRSLVRSFDHVKGAGTQLGTSSQTLASAANESSASLEETAASIEEISSMVKANAESAEQAALLSQKSCDSAQSGETEIERLLQAITEISASSKQIEEIITIIDDIAFQTNLLALNAAVEAARAGEQGRGFAIVADAVRQLAQRSAAAAKDISGKIRESVSKTEAGTRIAGEFREVLKEIVSTIQKVALLNKEIACASQEQTSGLEQVSKAMGELDQTTQSNASSSNSIASAAHELQNQSETLGELIGNLRTITGAQAERDLAEAGQRNAA